MPTHEHKVKKGLSRASHAIYVNLYGGGSVTFYHTKADHQIQGRGSGLHGPHLCQGEG